MTEQEWLAGGDPNRMLEFLRGKASDRKLRLFACICCLQNPYFLLDQRGREVIKIAERYADGEVDRQVFHDWGWMRAKGSTWPWPATLYEAWSAAVTAAGFTMRREEEGIIEVDIPVPGPFYLRDLIGNPFRPITFDPIWRTPSVIAVAQTIYAERRFADLPILADVLEEAGCTNADILDHCRSGGEHVRGCWAVDLVLDKQ